MTSQDPFASQREPGNDPFHTSPHGSPHSPTKLANISGSEDMGIDSTPAPNKDRRMSKEWDASKVPPSRFQRREGSIHATPASRDAHVKGSGRDKAYFDKLKEKGWDKLTRH
ncbi:hypothetical protein M011DRAFT_470625 [Sporormia fimetaria CBS 119925]|uniref:Uncharacterized protein n=1 Tax=Sporormia fimetaria CBS 119925 TaxID=1340428 RepID=A0A6A6V0Z1_9PLEO|nr:hypothetical protein M011DRAFT_470625 [Sporormia fimetaria CBS 119925]